MIQNVDSSTTPVWDPADDREALLWNLHLTQPVYISESRPVTADSDSIPPLGSVVVDGRYPIYASSAASGITIPLQVTAGGRSVQPSPAQVSQQLSALGLAKDTSVVAVKTTLGTPAQTADISAVKTTLGTPAQTVDIGALHAAGKTVAADIGVTGVPLLLKQSKLAAASNTTIGPGAVVTLNGGSELAIDQPTVDIFLSLSYSSVNGANPYAGVQIAWFDSTGTNQVWYDTAVAIIGSNGSPFTTQIRVPARGFFFNVIVDNLDTGQQITAAWEIEKTSFPVSDIDVRWGIPIGTAPGLVFPTGLYGDSKIVACHVNTALAHGTTDTITLPPAPGRLWVNFFQQGVATLANMSLRLDATPPSWYSGTTSAAFLIDDVLQAGNPTKETYLINGAAGPMRVRIANNDPANAANYVLTLARG